MLNRGEIKAGFVAPNLHLDIVTFIRALRYVIGGAVGNAGQHVRQLCIQFLRLGIHRGDFGLFVADQRAQAFKFGLIALGFGSTDFLAGLVLLGLCRLSRSNLGAARGIEGQHSLRHRSFAPAGKSGIKSLGIVADGADIVHRSVLGIG